MYLVLDSNFGKTLSVSYHFYMPTLTNTLLFCLCQNPSYPFFYVYPSQSINTYGLTNIVTNVPVNTGAWVHFAIVLDVIIFLKKVRHS
jgi:hypothetical protein